MSKFLITYSNKRSFYSYTKISNRIVHTALSTQEIEALLQDISHNQIIDIVEKGNNSIEITFENNRQVVIDDARVFKNSNLSQDKVFDRLQQSILEFDEKKKSEDKKINELQTKIFNFLGNKNFQKYKDSLPKGYVPKTNRNKSKFKGKKLIVGGLSALIIFYFATGYNNDIKQEELEIDDITPEFSYDIQKTTIESDLAQSLTATEKQVKEQLESQYHDLEVVTNSEVEQVIQNEEVAIEPEASSINLSLNFEDRTHTGKLQELTNFCGDIIEYYSLRYGLPSKVMCAQFAQESPNVINGTCENVCQITYDFFVGEEMHVPVYDEFGFTGEYDDFTITKEMLDTTEGNIMVGMAYNRMCVDKFESLATGLFTYNQGINALRNACKFYDLDINNYLGDENSIAARDLINKYYEEGLGKKHGDADYLENVFSYYELGDRGSESIQYYLGNELKTIELVNTNVYNSELSR